MLEKYVKPGKQGIFDHNNLPNVHKEVRLIPIPIAEKAVG
jgi:hypothetical protein